MKDKINVLIVDDNVVNRLAAKSVLMLFPVSILEADGGERALHMVMEESIDVIFMDILMPEMDGIETTKYIRSLDQGKQLKIIATSGTEIQNREQYLKVNEFDDILMKPLEISETLKCLSQWYPLSYDSAKVEIDDRNLVESNDFSQHFNIVKDLDLRKGLKYAHNSEECYLRVIKTSLRQLNDTIELIHNYLQNQNNKQIYLQLHSIKSVFFYLGAQELGKMVNQFEAFFMQGDETISDYGTYIKSMKDFQIFIQRITIFRNELEQAIQAYDNSIKNERNETNEVSESTEEINQLIETITLHTYRFEYVEIMNGLRTLEQIVNTKSCTYVSEAIVAAEEFNYDRVKAMLVGCWNEVNDNNK